jgi:hypothetical protein
MVDAGIAVSRPQIATVLAGIGPEPVTHLINIHGHFGHANGNDWLYELGPKIPAHENTRAHLSMTQHVDDWDFNFPALSAGALPTAYSRRRLQVGAGCIRLSPSRRWRMMRPRIEVVQERPRACDLIFLRCRLPDHACGCRSAAQSLDQAASAATVAYLSDCLRRACPVWSGPA